MEKRTPHCSLVRVKTLIGEGKVRTTPTTPSGQDVYRPKTTAGDVYLKLTVIDDVLIVSFKEL